MERHGASVTERLEGLLAWALRVTAPLLPPERREWAQAVRQEAAHLPRGWPRLDWLAGGLWLVVREAHVVRKFVYWAGIGGVAAIAIWATWRSWTNVPTTDVEVQTDRVRLLVAAMALIALPWVGRRRGWFGPVGNGVAARLCRVAGFAAIWGLGLYLVRLDKQGGATGYSLGGINWLQEIGGLVLLAAVVTVPLIIKARRPYVEASTLWSLSGMAAVIVLVILPVQLLAIAYIAGILLATSRRSPVTSTSLIGGAMAGLVAAAISYELAYHVEQLGLAVFGLMVVVIVLAAAPVGAISAWQVAGQDYASGLREARIRQGLLAGTVAGACCGLVVVNFGMFMVVTMILGPAAGLVGGALGGAFADQHPLPRRDGSRAAGFFVSSS
jgi:hypothetical protein